MQIINLTHAEAADPAVVETVLKLTGTGLSLIDGKSGFIDPLDRPDAGVEVVQQVPFTPPLGVVPPAPGAAIDTAAVFGGQSAASAAPLVPPVPVASPPSAAIVPTAVLSAAVPGGAATVNAEVPAAPVHGVEVDSSGLPWDARIHAGNKATKQDGTWKVKKGINDPSFIPRIEAELRAALAAPGVATPAAAAVPPPPPVPASPGVPVAPVAAPAVVTPSAAPAAPAAVTFQSLMAKLAPFMASGALKPEKQTEVLAAFGLTSLGGLMQRPDLVPSVAALFDSILAELG